MHLRRLVAASLVPAALLAPACGEDPSVDAQGRDGPAIAEGIELTLVLDPPDAEHSAAAADVAQARLRALGIEDTRVESANGAIDVTVPAGDEELARAALEAAGVLELRPVLEVLPAGGEASPNPAQKDAEAVLDAEDGARYRVGPVALDGTAVESASAAVTTSGEWAVNPVLREGARGIDAFNEIASECFESRFACPDTGMGAGQLAIVIDGRIHSAPSVQASSYQRDQITIAGGFDERGARVLAAALDAGAAPVRWTLRG